MASWLVPPRRHDPELMDAPGLDPDEVADAYRVLQRVNVQLGNLRTLLREVDRAVTADGLHGAVSLLDVGSGSGDLPQAVAKHLERRGLQGRVIALDHDPVASTLARTGALTVLQADALRLPLPDASVDLVTATKFAHHFHGAGLSRLVSEMARVARRRVIVLDIRRHWLAYAGFKLWSRVFTRNRLVRYDGPLSVLRGFTAAELQDVVQPLTAFSWSVRPYLGFQLALVGQRRSGAF